jgi:hypothetical protein
MNRFETVDMDLDLDDTEFKIIREQSKKRRRGHKKAQHTISKREKAALKKWEMEIIKEYEKANEKIKRKKSCKKQPLIKTLYAIKKPKTSRRKRRSLKVKTEEQPESESESESSSQTNTVPAITTTAAVAPAAVAPAAVEAVTAETQEPAVTTPASEPESEPVVESKPTEEPASENKTMLSSMAESFGFSPSQEEKGTTESPEPKTGGKRKSSKAKKGGKSKTSRK